MYLLLLFLVGAVFGLAIIGTIFNNKLTDELEKNLPPGLKMGGNRKGFDKINTLPPNIKVIFIHAFVSAFDLSFKVVIAMGALTLISALFMRNVKPKLKSDEKDGGSAGLSE